MRIWLPETLYRLFPKAAFLAGMFFALVPGNWATMALSSVLVGYGFMMWTLRLRYN